MKRRNLSLIFFLFIMHACNYIHANDATNNTLKQSQAQTAAMVFPAGLPTTSMNEKKIDIVYGSAGLNIKQIDLTNIKQTYCYLEFLTKLDKVKNDKTFAQYQADFKDFLHPNPKNTPLMPTQTLVDSKGWQAIPVNAQDILDSTFWQTFVKAMISDSLDNDALFIVNSTQTNNQMFPYIPNLETAYYTNNFTQLRLYQESIQLQTLIQERQRQRYIAQCNDWKNINQSKIVDAVAQYKKESFYTYTHTPQPTPTSKSGSAQPIVIPSPISEQIVCYFMLIHIQTVIHDIMTQTNTQSILTTIQATQLSPNFFMYNASDIVLLSDILTLQSLNDTNKITPSPSAITMNPTPNGGIILTPDATPTPSANNVAIQAVSPTPSTTHTPQADTQVQAATMIFQQLPTTSTYEAIIEKIYGTSGLNIATDQLANLKKTYCYLEFLAKINNVKNNPQYAQYKIDFKNFLEPNKDGKPLMPTQALVASKGWQAVTITNDDIIASSEWQNFLKAMICDCHDNQTNFILDSTLANNQMFPYIPNIETGYATNDFTQMRLYTESIQLHALMGAKQKQLYLQQCIDWKNIDQTKIDETVIAFKKTDFYNYTHKAQGSNQKLTISSPLTEQIVSYFILITMQNNIYEMLTLDNLASFLHQASSPSLSPNVFSYTSSDFIYLSDFLSLKNLINQNIATPKISTVTMSVTPQDASSNTNEVVIQKIKDPFKKMEDGFKKDIIDPTKKAVIDPIKKQVIDPINKNFKKEFADPAMKGLRTINKGINTGFKGMVSGIIIFSNDLATGLIETCSGITWVACSFGNAIGIKNDPNKEAHLVKSKMNAHKAIISSVLGTVFIVVAAVLFVMFTGGLGLSVVAGLFIGAAVTDKRFSKQLNKYVEAPLMKGMMGIMQGMAAMTDAFTTGFIEMSVGLTWLGCSVGQACGAKVNPNQEANKVRATMEKYRSTINIVMSVVITVLITIVIIVITAGAGAAEMAAIDAGFFGAEAAAAAAETAAAAAATAATTSTATVVATTAAEEAAILAAQEAAEQAAILGTKEAASAAAQAAAKEAAATAARQAAEQSAKQAADIAAQSAAKAVARRVAIKATEDLTSKQLTEAAAQTAAKQTATVAAQDSSNVAAQTAAKEAADAAAKATAERITAEQAAKKASEEAAQKTVQVADQAAAKASKIAAEKQASMFEKISASMGRGTTTDAAGTTTTRTASQQAADQTAAKLTTKATELASQQAEKEAAQLAAKQAAQKALEDAALSTEKIAQTAENAAQQASMLAADGNEGAVAAAEEAHAAATAARTAADQAAAKLATQQAADKAVADLTEKTAAELATKQAGSAAGKDAAALAEKQTAQQAARATAKQAAEKESATLAEKESADATLKAAQETLAKDPTNVFSQAAVKAAQNSANIAAKNATEATVERIVADQLAVTMDQSLLESATEITAKESARLAARSAFQVAQEEGMLNATRGGVSSWSFIIGQALNAGFGVFSAMAAVNQDDAAAEQLAAEEKSIKTLWRFVEDNKVTITQQQNQFLDELHKKHQVAIENQAFGLQYYTNFLNGSVDNVQDQIAQALAQQYVQMLTPDNNGLRNADIGSTWGLQTQFDYLYPAQGFTSTTLGRPDFPYAQEVAQAPLASESHSETSADLSDKQPAATKLWFNQRAVSVINQPVDSPLNIEIKFRVIYNLTTAYHIGLYLGGNYHDYNSAAYLQSLKDQGAIDVDEAHLAKMFVLKRDDKDAAPSLGLYENEGKGWIVQQPVDANTLNNASIYHMSAKLNKDQLTIAFWSESNPSAKWTNTTTVTPCDQRTFGVIFSGLAIEWDVVQPNLPIVQNKTARIKTNGQSEIDRERASKAQWKQLLNPKFGSMHMQSAGRPAILQGQYLYTTQDTLLTDGQGNTVTDYIVFATSSSNTVNNIGANPAPSDTSQTPNAIVSLITGNVYNSSGKVITHKQNALDTYAQVNTTLSQSLGNTIAQAAQLYQQQLLNYKFGTYQLTALSQDAVNAGLFIYTCPTTITALDTSGQPILDYLVMADLVGTSLGSTIGMPPSNTVPGMVSLITGNVYNKTSATPVDSGYSEIAQYTKSYGKLPQSISNAISTASNAYNNVQEAQEQAVEAKKEAQVHVIGSATISLSDLLNAAPPSTGGFQLGLSSAAPSNIVATNGSISQLQTSAAGSATVQFGGFGPAGFDMSSFGGGFTSGSDTAPVTYAMPNTSSTTGTAIAIHSGATSVSAPISTNNSTSITTTQQVPVTSTSIPVNTTSAQTFSGQTFSNILTDDTAAPVNIPAPEPSTFTGISIRRSASPATNTTPVPTADTSNSGTFTPPAVTQPINNIPIPVNTPVNQPVSSTDFTLAGSSGFSF